MAVSEVSAVTVCFSIACEIALLSPGQLYEASV